MNKKRFWILILIVTAVFSAVLFNLASILIYAKALPTGKFYTHISLANPDALNNLAPMVRDILDGHWWVSDGRTYEYSDAPNLWSFVNPVVIAPLTLTLKSIPLVFFLGRILFIFSSFFIFYLIIKELTKNRSYSLLFSIFFFALPYFGPYLFPARLFNIKLILRTFTFLGSPPGEMFPGLTNSFGIFPTLPVMLAALLFLYRALVKGGKINLVLATSFLGLLIYMYITDALYIYAALGVIFLLTLFKRDKKNLGRIALIGTGALIISIGHWINVLHIRTLPYADEFFRRLGGEFTHEFRWSWWPEYLLYSLGAVLIWRMAKKKNDKTGLFIIGFSLAPIVMLNLHVLLGYNPLAAALLTHQFIFGFAFFWGYAFYWFYEFCRSQPSRARFLRIVFILIVLAGVSRVAYTNIYMVRYLAPAFYLPENLLKSFQWLEANTPRDSSVATPSLITNAYLPVLTGNTVLTARALTTPAPLWEVLDRRFVLWKLYNVSPEYIEKAFRKELPYLDHLGRNHENGVMSDVFENWVVGNEIDEPFNAPKHIPEEEIKRLVQYYKKYPGRPGYLFTRYRLDYLYVGPYEQLLMKQNFDQLDFLEKIYDEDKVKIYRVKHDMLVSRN